MEYISYRQSLFLLSMMLPVTGHMLLLSPLFTISGRDGWIAIILTLPIGLFLAFVLYRLHTLNPEKTIVGMLEKAFGVWVGKILTISILGYFFYMLIITLYALFDFIQVIFLPEAPRWALAIGFYIVVLYGALLGIESITRMAEGMFLIIAISGIIIAIAVHTERNYENLFPLFENGALPIFSGILLTTAVFGEFIILLMLRLKKDHPKSKSLLFTTIITILLITGMFVAAFTSSIAIFGAEQFKQLNYPLQSIVRVVRMGFIERLDIFGVGAMVFGCVIRMATFQYILNLGIRQWLTRGNKWLIHILIAIAALGYTLIGIENQSQFFEVYLTKYYPLTAIISVGLPILTWLLLELKTLKST